MSGINILLVIFLATLVVFLYSCHKARSAELGTKTWKIWNQVCIYSIFCVFVSMIGFVGSLPKEKESINGHEMPEIKNYDPESFKAGYNTGFQDGFAEGKFAVESKQEKK